MKEQTEDGQTDRRTEDRLVDLNIMDEEEWRGT